MEEKDEKKDGEREKSPFLAIEQGESDEETARQERRRKRLEEAKREKKRQQARRKKIKRMLPGVAAAAAILVLLILVTAALKKDTTEEEAAQARGQMAQTEAEGGTKPEAAGSGSETDGAEAGASESGQLTEGTTPGETESGTKADSPANTAEAADGAETANAGVLFSKDSYSAQITEDTRQPGEDVFSSYAVMLDADSGTILAQRDAMARISPASMTKILTVLVAAEQQPDLDDTFTITREITDYSYVNDCSSAGFLDEETVTVRDLFYGTILPSGADAAAGLAIYTAGSLDAFVELMNEKLEQLGLSDTAHVTNCVGLYDENHYCTVYDMAVILKAAIQNELCREVLSAHTYTTSPTTQHPEGITLSNWFLRRIEDKETGGEVLYAKTGYVAQSGNCAASYELGNDGKGYICVTANATSSWRCIYDHVAMYEMFLGEQ